MAIPKFIFKKNTKRPVIISGPCLAESKEIVDEVASFMSQMAKDLEFDYVFKASFDKANRTSINSDRGPGWEVAKNWFIDVKEKYNIPVLTDIHEAHQAKPVSEVCDVLQIPAFLCRQTDILISAVDTGKAVNVKKGQFLAPENTAHIAGKIKAQSELNGLSPNFALTERGSTFGYGNLVVDMRGLKIMSDTGSPLIFDVTHSLQLPSMGGASGEVSGGAKEFAPVLSRAAAATGYLDGLFIETHPNPKSAKSDSATQLSLPQTESLLKSVLPLWHQAKDLIGSDSLFHD